MENYLTLLKIESFKKLLLIHLFFGEREEQEKIFCGNLGWGLENFEYAKTRQF